MMFPSKKPAYILAVIFILGIAVGAFLLLQKPGADEQRTKNLPAATPNSSAQFTSTEVSAHNKPTDCQVIVGDGVYNLTAWISEHPGGSDAIIGLCGTDASAAFAQQHGSNREAQKALASFKIGTLKQ